jgi:hypothetical protein
MPKRKIKNPEDLKGFEEYLESLNFSPLKINENKRLDENFELYTFLELNNLRISKILDLFSHQIHTIKNYPQDIGLVIKAEANNMALREKIHKKLLKKDSNYYKHLEHLFNRFFS